MADTALPTALTLAGWMCTQEAVPFKQQHGNKECSTPHQPISCMAKFACS